MAILDRLLLKITADSSELQGQMRQAGDTVEREGRRIEGSWDGVRRGLAAVRNQIAAVAVSYLGVRAAMRFVADLSAEAIKNHADLAAQASELEESWEQFKRTSAEVLHGPLAQILEWSNLFLTNLRAIELGWAKAFTTTGPERLREAEADLTAAAAELAKAKARGDDPDRPGFIAMERRVAELEALVESLRQSPASFIETIAPLPFNKPTPPEPPRTPAGAKPKRTDVVLAPLGASRMEQILGTTAEAREAFAKLRAEADRMLAGITDAYLRATGEQEELLRRGLDRQLAELREARGQGAVTEEGYLTAVRELWASHFAELDRMEAERNAEAKRQADEIVAANRAAAEELRQVFAGTTGEIRRQFETLQFSIQGILRALLGDLASAFAEFGFGQIFGSASTGGGLLGSVLGGLGLPGFAAGGPIRAGQPAIVGERGPELFVPRAPGTIVPNGARGGGGSSVVVNQQFVLNPGADQLTVAALHRTARAIKDAAVAEIQHQQQRSFGAFLAT